MEDSFLTVAEIAGVLMVNQMTVGNWIDRGELPAMHVGRRVRVKRTDFDRFIEDSYIVSGRERPATSAPNVWEGEIPPPALADSD
jgi:excisionase family DNA binding protein